MQPKESLIRFLFLLPKISLLGELRQHVGNGLFKNLILEQPIFSLAVKLFGVMECPGWD